MNDGSFRLYMNDQVETMKKYICTQVEETGCDQNSASCEWVKLFAAEFRVKWEQEHPGL